MPHKAYRSWFTREAIQLLGVEAEIDRYLRKKVSDGSGLAQEEFEGESDLQEE